MLKVIPAIEVKGDLRITGKSRIEFTINQGTTSA